jgi:Zinc-binding dehydrogenase
VELIFQVTDNMKALGIESFKLVMTDLQLSLSNGKQCCIHFSPKKCSISELVKNIDKRLWLALGNDITEPIITSAIQDIENQLVERRDEIFCISGTRSHTTATDKDEDAAAKQKYVAEVNELRKKFKDSKVTYQQWQSLVAEKYEILRNVVKRHYPEAWIFLEFSLAVKTILNIEGLTLPFMGVILAAPASTKTLTIQLFRKYPGSFYTDSFTASSLVSHNSALTEEQLQKVDMLPKIKDKLVLTPELSSIFTAKDDDLQKVLGTLTRVLDGHGFENDTGAQGHRKYGNTMFVWLGSAVEIPPRVWKLLGTLGHKLYFLRPPVNKKTIYQLKKLAKHNNFSANNKEIESALIDYLKTFDSAPEEEDKTKLDPNGNLKVRWIEEVEEEQDRALEYIAQIGNLLASLRGTTYVPSRPDHTRQQTSEIYEYDSGITIIEDASRAVILLRNLAIGHAISQGRDSIDKRDIPIVIKTAFSTAIIRRVMVLDLLLKNHGEITTSQIKQQLKISDPTTRLTIREFEALKIVDISTISGYANAELKATLRSEFDWFNTEEFEKLREGFIPASETSNKNNSNNNSNEDDQCQITNPSFQPKSESNESNYNTEEACDLLQSHTLKANSPPQRGTRNDVLTGNEKERKEERTINSLNEPSTENTESTEKSESIGGSKGKIENQSEYCKDDNEDLTTNRSINDIFSDIKKNVAPAGGAVKAIMELTDKLGADAVIDFVNASKTVETDMQFLRRRARLVLVGLFGGELKLALVTMPTRAYKIIGSYTGTLSDMIELVSLARRGVIKPVVSNRFKLNQATEALTMLKEGKILGRGVINP